MQTLHDGFSRSKKPGPARRPEGAAVAGARRADGLEGLLVAPSGGVFVLQEGLIRRCNRFLSEKCGYRPEEVAETAFASFFDSETAATVESVARSAACGDPPPRPAKANLVAKDGRRLRVRLAAAPCSLSGRPAVLIVLAEAPGRPREERRADLPRPWLSTGEEELALPAAAEF